jgi:hypothetical protein
MPAFNVAYRVVTPGRSVLTGTVEVFGAHDSEARASASRALSRRGVVTITRVTRVR